MIINIMGNIESNLYVTSFVPTVKEDLGRLSELADEINQEKQDWQNSGVAEEIVRALLTAYGSESEQFSPREFKKMVMLQQGYIFGEIRESATVKHSSTKEFGQLPLRIRKAMLEVEGIGEEHRSNYQEAIRPLVEQRTDIERGLYTQLLDFMSGLRPVQDFTEFLADLEFAPLREQQRPFLEFLAHRLLSVHGGHSTDLISSEVLKNTQAKLEQEEFDDFLTNLSKQKSNKIHDCILQWLSLISYPAEEVDYKRVFEQIVRSGIFPTDLKDSFTTYIRERLSSYILTIKGSLGNYNPKVMHQPTFSIAAQTRVVGRHKRDMQLISKPVSTFSEDEMPKRPDYELAIGRLTDVSQEDLDAYIKQTSDGLAPHDVRMRNDIAHMIAAVSEDPFGFGVSKLTVFTTFSQDGLKKLPLRRFRPDKRPSLTLEHPDSRNIRIVFHRENRHGRNMVVIDDILRHDDFDKEYT